MASTSTFHAPLSSPKDASTNGSSDGGKKLTHAQVKAGWREGFSESEKRPYHYNIYTRESVWVAPSIQSSGPVAESQAEPGPTPDVLAAAVAELSGNPPLQLAQPPFVKGKHTTKRSMSDGDLACNTEQKKTKFSPDPDQEENERNAVRFHIGGERYAFVKRFKGRVYVNIREFYYNDEKTKLLAGKKGLNLTAGEWFNLVEKRAAIAEAVEKV